MFSDVIQYAFIAETSDLINEVLNMYFCFLNQVTLK